MGLGSAAVKEMQKTIEKNRAASKNRKRSIQKGGVSGKIKFKEVSEKEYQAWKANYKVKRKKELIRNTTVVFLILSVITVVFYLSGVFN